MKLALIILVAIAAVAVAIDAVDDNITETTLLPSLELSERAVINLDLRRRRDSEMVIDDVVDSNAGASGIDAAAASFVGQTKDEKFSGAEASVVYGNVRTSNRMVSGMVQKTGGDKNARA